MHHNTPLQMELTFQQQYYRDKYSAALDQERTSLVEMQHNLSANHKEWMRGKSYRREQGLYDDQETGWNISGGKKTLNTLLSYIQTLNLQIQTAKANIRMYEDRLQTFQDSLGLVEDTSSAAHFMMTDCPSSETDDEGKAEWIKFNTFTSDEEDDDKQ